MGVLLDGNQGTMTDVPEAKPPRIVLIPPVTARDHAQGPATAEITLVVYGDYHAPQCAAAQRWIKALQAMLGDRLRLVFRHFPAISVHPHAAEAAEAAGLQGNFWKMHDTLFAHQSELGNGYLVEYAPDMGLEMSWFLQDMTGHVSAERVHADIVSGTQSGVQNTPTFFVNGVRQPGPWTESASWGKALVGTRHRASAPADHQEPDEEKG